MAKQTQTSKPAVVVPTDLRPADEVGAEIRHRTLVAAKALLAAFEAVQALADDVDDQALRLGDCAAVAARGANELRALYIRLGEEWGPHPDLEEALWSIGLLAAAQACAMFAAMSDVLVSEHSRAHVEHRGSYLVGLEWIVRFNAKAFPGEANEGDDARCEQ